MTRTTKLLREVVESARDAAIIQEWQQDENLRTALALACDDATLHNAQGCNFMKQQHAEIIATDARDIIAAILDLKLGTEWQTDAWLKRAYNLACDPATPECVESTRVLAQSLFEGLNNVYGPDMSGEDVPLNCPIRWLYFASCDVLRAIDEARGVAWWQIAAREAANARTARDQNQSAASLKLAA